MGRLFRFTIPSIVMMIFTSIYNVVDGFFVSNFTGKLQFACVNLVMPFLMLLSVIGFMVGTGGNAIVSKYLGENNGKKANEVFSMLVTFTTLTGILFFVLGEVFMPNIVRLLGATDDMMYYCVLYGRIICISLTPFILHYISILIFL